MPMAPVKINDLPDLLPSPVDVMICCASFERRSLSVALLLKRACVRRALICEHVNMHRYMASNVNKLRKHFGSATIPVRLDSSSPVRSADALMTAIDACHTKQRLRVVVDITTFTHETLMICGEILALTLSPRDDVRFVYTVAKEYDPGTRDTDKWLSKGILSVRSVLGFPGDIRPGRDVHLILLHGFEIERSKSLIDEYEPDLLSLGRPTDSSSTCSPHALTNARVHKEVLRYAQNVADVIEFEFAANDPLGCRDAIGRQACARPDINVVAATMNTKLSALGALLAARDNPNIQLCYAQPVTYNYDNYSLAGDECYCVSLPELFGNRRRKKKASTKES